MENYLRESVMKKLIVLATLFAGVLNLNAAGDESWKFEPTIGPGIGIRNYEHQFDMNLKFGKENWGGTLDFGLASTVSIRPAVTFDYPFYISIDKSHDFSVGPTFSAGPSFLVSGNAKGIDFAEFGVGLRLSYLINDNFGVVCVPAHLSMSFLRWLSGPGFDADFNMSYDMKFGVFLLL
jgi:hypothetical protein